MSIRAPMLSDDRVFWNRMTALIILVFLFTVKDQSLSTRILLSAQCNPV
jgi:hypothetical protein